MRRLLCLKDDGTCINPVSALCRLVNRALTHLDDNVSVFVVSFSARCGRRRTCAQTGGCDGNSNRYDHPDRTYRGKTAARIFSPNRPAVPAKGFRADGGFLLGLVTQVIRSTPYFRISSMSVVCFSMSMRAALEMTPSAKMINKILPRSE